MSRTTQPWSGNRLVLVLYLIVVATAGAMGLILGTISPRGLDPDLFFFIDMPSTPIGVAMYGVLTVGITLGILFFLMVFLTRRYDTDSF